MKCELYIAQPTECINQLSGWYLITYRVLKTLQRQRNKVIHQWFSLLGASGHQGQKWPNCNRINWGQRTYFTSVSAKFGGFIWLMRTCVEKNELDLIFEKRSDCVETQTWYVIPPTRCIYQVSSSYSKTCRKNPETLSLMLKIPLPVVCGHQRAKIAQPWRKSVRVKTLATCI